MTTNPTRPHLKLLPQKDSRPRWVGLLRWSLLFSSPPLLLLLGASVDLNLSIALHLP